MLIDAEGNIIDDPELPDKILIEFGSATLDVKDLKSIDLEDDVEYDPITNEESTVWLLIVNKDKFHGSLRQRRFKYKTEEAMQHAYNRFKTKLERVRATFNYNIQIL